MERLKQAFRVASIAALIGAEVQPITASAGNRDGGDKAGKPTLIEQENTPEIPIGGIGTTTAKNVLVHRTPSRQGEVIVNINADGTQVVLFGKKTIGTETWYRVVDGDGYEGWILGTLLTVDEQSPATLVPTLAPELNPLPPTEKAPLYPADYPVLPGWEERLIPPLGVGDNITVWSLLQNDAMYAPENEYTQEQLEGTGVVMNAGGEFTTALRVLVTGCTQGEVDVINNQTATYCTVEFLDGQNKPMKLTFRLQAGFATVQTVDKKTNTISKETKKTEEIKNLLLTAKENKSLIQIDCNDPFARPDPVFQPIQDKIILDLFAQIEQGNGIRTKDYANDPTVAPFGTQIQTGFGVPNLFTFF